MKLVKFSNYSSHYINMDYITEVYKCPRIRGDYYAIVNNNHSYKIDEETYNTILAYGKAKV